MIRQHSHDRAQLIELAAFFFVIYYVFKNAVHAVYAAIPLGCLPIFVVGWVCYRLLRRLDPQKMAGIFLVFSATLVIVEITQFFPPTKPPYTVENATPEIL